MARIVKKLSPNRAEWSFGDLMYWHLRVYGTRPKGDPTSVAGRLWETTAFCDACRITDRALRFWFRDEHLPDSTSAIAAVLFGDNPLWDERRLELQDTLVRTHMRRAGINAPAAAIHSEAPPIAPDTTATTEDEAVGSEAADSAEKQEEEKEKPGNGEPESSPAMPAAVHAHQHPRKRFPIYLGILLILGAGYAASQMGRQPEKKVADATPTAPTPAPKPPAPTPSLQFTPTPKAEPARPILEQLPPERVNSEIAPASIAPPVRAVPAPVSAPVAPSPPQPTQAEVEAEAKRQARVAAFDKAEQEREREAVRLDKTNGDPGAALRESRSDARDMAGLGFSLRENQSSAGTSLGNSPVANLTECAAFCDARGCDAFAFYRDQYGPGSTRPRYCYLYAKPLSPYANAGHVYGERVATSPAQRQPDTNPPIRLAQATSNDASDAGDGIVRCLSGPVKVTGFQLKCDTTISGGTTLGSTQLSYTVRNINECASKCRPVRNCVGFTFNSSDPDGRHACMLFGPTPEARDSSGWIAGTR